VHVLERKKEVRAMVATIMRSLSAARASDT